MSVRITSVDVHDVRLPTAAAGDGSDATDRGDHSATYVELGTDAGVLPEVPGHSATMRPGSIAEFRFPDGPAWR